MGEGQVGGAQYRDKDLGRMDDTGRRIDHRHRQPGIIGLHHCARLVPVAERDTRALPKGGNLAAEPCEAVAVGMAGAVLLPQERQGHALALQLPNHLRPIRLADVPWRPAGAAEQPPLQLGILVRTKRERP